MVKTLFVIEHLEPKLSQWLLLEYKHASKIVGKENLIITNAKGLRNVLNEIAVIFEESIIELLGTKIKPNRVIVLEPKAKELLRPEDFIEYTLVIVGGIMGDHPPKGRTWKLLTSKLLGIAEPRSLGPYQFSIDGAVYMAYQVSKGKRLEDIEVVYDIEIEIPSPYPSIQATIRLPYAYPIVNGKPLLAPGLIDYLKYNIVIDEEVLLNKN